MDKYIRKQDAIRWVKTECNPYGKPTLDFESGKRVIEHLEQMPAADVVEVVRCRDCKHWQRGMIGMGCYWDADYPHEENDFCSRGERKEE